MEYKVYKDISKSGDFYYTILIKDNETNFLYQAGILGFGPNDKLDELACSLDIIKDERILNKLNSYYN